MLDAAGMYRRHALRKPAPVVHPGNVKPTIIATAIIARRTPI